MNGASTTCCADTGAHHSIISEQSFIDLNLDKKLMNTKQRYNIKTATTLELDAVQGEIVVPLVFYNLCNGKTQNFQQKFLVLRADHCLNMPLIGCDFLKPNNGGVLFHQNLPTEIVINNKVIGSPPDFISVRFEQTSTAEYAPDEPVSNKSDLHSPVHELLDSTYYPGDQVNAHSVPINVFSSFIQQCRQEKISRLIRQDPKYVNCSTTQVNRIITETYDSEFPELLQKHSMIPADLEPSNPELKVDVSHLDSEMQKKFL